MSNKKRPESREQRAKRLINEKFLLISTFALSAGDTISESEAVISIRGMLKDIETMQLVVSKDAVLIGHASADQITRERASLSEGMAVLAD